MSSPNKSEQRVLKAAVAWLETRPHGTADDAKAKANAALFDAVRAYKPVAPPEREYGESPHELEESMRKHFGKHLRGDSE